MQEYVFFSEATDPIGSASVPTFVDISTVSTLKSSYNHQSRSGDLTCKEMYELTGMVRYYEQ